jgi:hypothetical protein
MLTEKMKRIDYLTHVIDRDRYVVAAGIQAVESSINARAWTTTGRGPYQWDDDDYRKEFGVWMNEVYRVMDVLRKVSLDKTDCTTDEIKVRAARKAALEIIETPHHHHREMVAGDLGLFDPSVAEIAKLRNELKEVQAKLKQYEPETDHAYCNKCGYYGPVIDDGRHNRRDGTQCNYSICKREPLKEITPEMRQIYLGILVMICHAHGDDGIDPSDLIKRLQSLLVFDLVIDICQSAFERGLIEYNSKSFVVAVGAPNYGIT